MHPKSRGHLQLSYEALAYFLGLPQNSIRTVMNDQLSEVISVYHSDSNAENAGYLVQELGSQVTVQISVADVVAREERERESSK